MRKIIVVLLAWMAAMPAGAQSAEGLFGASDTKITYLGIDFSHVKLIGNFAEFFEAGRKNTMEIRDVYFPRWNMVVVNEREKYDISGMLRKNSVYYDLDMIMSVNAGTALDSLESLNEVVFTEEDISRFVSGYDLSGKQGIGIVFIAESLNKSSQLAVFHFVAIDMGTGQVLFQRRLRGEPQGFGLRNYWINALYRIINNIKNYYFDEWRMATRQQGTQAKTNHIPCRLLTHGLLLPYPSDFCHVPCTIRPDIPCRVCV
jgi:hypothetical protein